MFYNFGKFFSGFVRKVKKAGRGIYDFLYIQYKAGKYIDDDFKGVLKGKRVAIVGPANSVMDEEKGHYIDQFDLIVRVNKSYQLVENRKNRKFIGSRTDMLISRLDDREAVDSDTFDYDMLLSQELKYLIGFIRSHNFGYYYRVVSFINRFGGLFGPYLRILSLKYYRGMLDSLDGNKPTAGYIALYILFHSDFEHLYVTGFTFFKTDYAKNYREGITAQDQLRKFKGKDKGHNPDKEYEVFKRWYSLNRERVSTDECLSKLINDPNS